jgi:hypothetical protein
MVMKITKRSKSAGGFTFTEIMGAILVLTVAVLGSSAYRYYAALDTRKADLQTTAARVGSLLCETWRGASEPNSYDPVAYFGTDLAIEDLYIPDTGGHRFPAHTGSTRLGAYRIVAEDDSYNAMLTWRDIYPGLRALNVVVIWGEQEDSYSSTNYSGRPNNVFRLTTYMLY